MERMIRTMAMILLLAGTGWAHDPNLGAIVEYSETLEKEPDNLEALKARGSTYRALEYYDSALLDLARADGLDPDNPEVVGEIGMCHYHLGEWDRTTEYLDRAQMLLDGKIAAGAMTEEEYLPVQRELWQYRFHNYQDLERYEEALKEAEKLKQFLSGKLSFVCEVGEVLLALGRPEEALPRFLQAVEANPSFERYCVGAANCLLLLGRTEEAVKIFEAWLADDAEAVMPYLHRAYILKEYLHRGEDASRDLAQAEAELSRRLEGEEWPDLEYVTELTRILQMQGRFQEAWDRLVPMLEDYRAHWLVVHLQSINAEALGRPLEAESLAREARLYKRLNPADWLQAYTLVAPPPEEEPELPDKHAVVIIVLGACLVIPLLFLLLRRRNTD